MAAVQVERARSLQELGRYQDALDVLDSTVQDEPSHATAQSLRAISLAGLHRFDDAIRTARVALQFAPSDPFCHFALSKVLLLKGDSRAARESIRAALEIEPNAADYHGLLAATFQAEHRWRRAIDAVDKGLQLDAENRACLFLKAALLSSKGNHSAALRTIESLLQIDPHFAPGLALYESLQREAGTPNVPSLSLQANPRQRYVKTEALNEILRRSVVFRWVVAIDRIGMRVGAPWLLLITIIGGLVLWLFSVTESLSGPVRDWLRGGSWVYATFLFAVVFGWCFGDVYLRFHASGRWLLSSLRRKGAEIVAAGFVLGGVVLVASAMARSRDLAFVGLGMIGGGLSISRSLAMFLRLASPSEFALSLAMSSGAVVAIAAGVGLWDRMLVGSLAACGLAAWGARVAGWRPE